MRFSRSARQVYVEVPGRSMSAFLPVSAANLTVHRTRFMPRRGNPWPP